MKNVSTNFTNKVYSAVKQYDYAILFAWEKNIDDDRRFFTLETSMLGGGDILWSGNQDVISFMDRYEYTNESKYCQTFSISRKVAQRPWGVIQGTAEITLNNASGRFFPGHDAVIGQFVNLPNRPVKIQIGIDGEYINLFSGYACRPVASVTNSAYKITAYDAVSYLSTCRSELNPMVEKPLHEIVAALLLEAGFSSDQFVLEESLQDYIGYVTPKDQNVADLLNKLCESEQYLIFADGDGIIHGWNANHYSVSAGNEVARLDFSNSVGIDWQTTSVLNDVSVIAKPYQVIPHSRFFSKTDVSDDDLVPANGTLDIFLNLQDDDNNTIYAIDYGTPAYNSNIGSSYTTNTVQNPDEDNPGESNHQAIQLISHYNFGNSVKLTFRNNSNIPTYITSISLVGSSAQQFSYVGKEAIDQDSIDNYGLNPDESTPGEIYELESEYIQSASFASNVAQRMVSLYVSPFNQLNVDTFIQPQLEIGDQIMVEVGGFGEHNTLIFGIELSGGSNAQFTQKLYLEERTLERYFTLDQSALNSGDILAM